MCEVMESYLEIARKETKQKVLVDLVKKSYITIQVAAQEAGLSDDEFLTLLNESSTVQS